MKINGRITILINQDDTSIELYDEDSGITFLKVKLSPGQLSSAMSRLAHTPCDSVEVRGLDKIGKKMEIKTITFPVPEHLRGDYLRVDSVNFDELAKHAETLMEEDGWIADNYFGSKDSFSYGENKVVYAKCILRRWIDKT